MYLTIQDIAAVLPDAVPDDPERCSCGPGRWTRQVRNDVGVSEIPCLGQISRLSSQVGLATNTIVIGRHFAR